MDEAGGRVLPWWDGSPCWKWETCRTVIVAVQSWFWGKRMVRSAAKAGAFVTLAALSLTACGGSSVPGDPKESRTQTSAAVPSRSAAPAKPIPAAFDSTRGWEVEAGKDGNLRGPAVASDAGLILFRSISEDKKTASVLAYDAKTGAIRWRSKPVANPTRDSLDADAMVFVTHKAGKEYAVLAVTGTEGGDGVNRASGVTRLAAYDTASSGEAAPVKETTVPDKATGYGVQRDGGLTEVQLGRSTAVVDVLSGQVTTYDRNNAALNAPKPCELAFGSCNTSTGVTALTPAGPLVQGRGAFWALGGWFSGDVVPAGASAIVGSSTVTAYGSPDGHVVAAWPSTGHDNDRSVWAVHDGGTGQVLATVECTGKKATPRLSSDGRYLIADFAVFDLQAKKGYCFEATGARNPVQLTTVDKDGTAYGNAKTPDQNTGGLSDTPTSVVLATGQASALPAGTLVPDLIGADAAVFGTDTGIGPVLVYPRR
ncbi:hypothetical protein [Streptomyces novaecaesareae]|uniref:hypothetical protein n=1 Tax=Streptomyces novaecaesareae TaxID=68244 RepID=UPI0012FE8736|nr:hypothetical protein [Streptomyces novaecaesareae]